MCDLRRLETDLRVIPGGVGVLPEKLGGGVRPASQNPYPIYDQNLRFSFPYIWSDQKFDILFMTVAAGTVALNVVSEVSLLIVLSIMVKLLLKHTQFKTRAQTPYPIYDQNGQNRFSIYDQKSWKTIPFGTAHTHVAHIWENPHPPRCHQG